MIDLYLDEDKQNRRIGILSVENTPPLQQILHNIRQRFRVKDEVHWSKISRSQLPLACDWIRAFFWYRGARFHLLDWPKNTLKQDLILGFLQRLVSSGRVQRLGDLYDVALFIDFDSIHKTGEVEQVLRDRGKIVRCMQLDSRSTDLLQLADLLLGAFGNAHLTSRLPFNTLAARWCDLRKILDDPPEMRAYPSLCDFGRPEIKAYIAGYLLHCQQKRHRKIRK